IGHTHTNPAQPSTARGRNCSTPNAPSACQLGLTTEIALIHPLASIKGPGSCGAEDIVRLVPIATRSSEGRYTEPTAVTQVWPPEPIFMPLNSAATSNIDAIASALRAYALTGLVMF